jgi:hypothetical protein
MFELLSLVAWEKEPLHEGNRHGPVGRARPDCELARGQPTRLPRPLLANASCSEELSECFEKSLIARSDGDTEQKTEAFGAVTGEVLFAVPDHEPALAGDEASEGRSAHDEYLLHY